MSEEPTIGITQRQRKLLAYLRERGAASSEAARMTNGLDRNIADALARLGMLNKRYDAQRGAVYWIRATDEPPTGASVRIGFVVHLYRDVTTPSGREESFFLARASCDGRGVTFRRLLRGWMRALGLRQKDLVEAWWGVEAIAADSPAFDEDHVVVEATVPDATDDRQKREEETG